MNRPTIKKVKQDSEHGSCHYCNRGKLKTNGIGLEYPYTHMMRVDGTNIVSNFCPECWETVKKSVD